MNQLAIQNKKGSNPNKAQSPLKNLDAHMKYNSSFELVDKYKIKIENVANKRNNKGKKQHLPVALKIIKSEDFIPQKGTEVNFLATNKLFRNLQAKNLVP